ncbi:MAG TPA: hypothetical protein VE842_17955 [Pyrinomonadaceae bacterium]|nr:hypothetical protein [Pyrinomonadaceae bacterium]
MTEDVLAPGGLRFAAGRQDGRPVKNAGTTKAITRKPLDHWREATLGMTLFEQYRTATRA